GHRLVGVRGGVRLSCVRLGVRSRANAFATEVAPTGGWSEYEPLPSNREDPKRRPRSARPSTLTNHESPTPTITHGLRASASSSRVFGSRSCLVTFSGPSVSIGQATRIEDAVPIT